MPEFLGGEKALFDLLAKNIKMPVLCAENNISGRVITRFVVRANGSISNIEIISSPHPLLSEESVRVLKLMPKWRPGRKGGKAVNVYFTLPFNFKVT